MTGLFKTNSVFTKELKAIFIIQVIFQLILFLLIVVDFFNYPFDAVQHVQTSVYFFLFTISFKSLKYSIANRTIIFLFSIEFFSLAISPLSLFYLNYPFNVNSVIIASLILFNTLHLFVYSFMPKYRDTYKHILISILIATIIATLTFLNIDLFLDYRNLTEDEYWKAINLLYLDLYYVYLINLSFLFFVWYVYNQEVFILSEYLSFIFTIHTLMIANEVYQLYNFNHFIPNYIDGLYFNFVINIGFIIAWLVRLKYISNNNKEHENYVINYDLLKGFIDKKREGIWGAVLMRLGKRNMLIGSILLFLLICIPLIFVGEINFYNKLNIILMFLFCAIVIIYAIIYTQKKWYNHIGFLFKPKK